jgi:hypothetical protein
MMAPWTATWDSLTVVPPERPLKFCAQNKKQVQPQHTHKMPINRRVLKSGTPEGGVTAGQLANQIYERHYSAEKVQDVHASEDIKK